MTATTCFAHGRTVVDLVAMPDEGLRMANVWALTIDCASPNALAEFWAAALGYVPSPPPTGFASWQAWLTEHGVPEDERDTGASISDPQDVAPTISFLQVRETKSVKNRLHLDIQAGGGRHHPWAQRWARIAAEVERLTRLGAQVVHEVIEGDRPDHVVMVDPEGNEFCVV